MRAAGTHLSLSLCSLLAAQQRRRPLFIATNTGKPARLRRWRHYNIPPWRWAEPSRAGHPCACYAQPARRAFGVARHAPAARLLTLERKAAMLPRPHQPPTGCSSSFRAPRTRCKPLRNWGMRGTSTASQTDRPPWPAGTQRPRTPGQQPTPRHRIKAHGAAASQLLTASRFAMKLIPTLQLAGRALAFGCRPRHRIHPSRKRWRTHPANGKIDEVRPTMQGPVRGAHWHRMFYTDAKGNYVIRANSGDTKARRNLTEDHQQTHGRGLLGIAL